MIRRYYAKKKISKYGNATSSLCAFNHSHRSKLESAGCALLQLRTKAGEIRDVQAEVRILICGPPGHECNSKCAIYSVVDFSFVDFKTGDLGYAEIKGFETTEWRMKLRLWRHYRPERLEIWKGTHLRPYLDEVIN